MKADIGLKDDDARGVAHLLNDVLSDEYVLYTKTRYCHWNVTGPEFSALHAFFEEQYRKLDENVDDVAERVRAVGGWAQGTLREFVERAELEEPGDYPDAPQMLAALRADHETLIKHLRNDVATCEKKYNDAGTANFLTDVMEKHEKMAWMLRAHARAGEKKEAARSTTRGRSAVNLMGDPSGAGE